MGVLPKEIHNEYSGRKVALYFFFLFTLMTLVRSLVHILSPDGGAQSIAKIPLDTFTQTGAETVILIFSLWGFSQLLLGIIYILVSCFYRCFVPLMYMFIIAENVMRLVLGILKPIEAIGTPGSTGSYVLIPLALIMFLLSRPK
ncbi:hypothetical protein C9J01_01815 [Photobacterium rosenbergii]|uniref:Uncharacterized protein n=1 Tax=Photobacterium rosenbergii TaxID=294936 RepID=A0A2T3NJU2_9GAMM|nr:hypothetical protein [Photobacterium rosenbergii]PSW15778.1 hypothetical protein C9J01_01815 [Photobacterium rosenbergii]